MEFVIGFSCPRKFKIGAFLIGWWAGKPYSHTYIRYTDAQERDLIFHAAHGNVHQILAENFQSHNQIVKEYVIECSKDDYQELRNICYAKSGLLYSTKQILLMPIYDLLLLMNITMKTKDDSGYICSELAGCVLNEIKNIQFKKQFNYLRPDDIEKALIENKFKTKELV